MHVEFIMKKTCMESIIETMMGKWVIYWHEPFNSYYMTHKETDYQNTILKSNSLTTCRKSLKSTYMVYYKSMYHIIVKNKAQLYLCTFTFL